MPFDYGLTRSPARILFGHGQVRALGPVAASLGRKALLCTDERIGSLPLLKEILADLAAHGVEARAFTETQPELPKAGIVACAERFRDFAPDMVIGLGGGSCMDLAKLVALLLSHGGDLSDYFGEFKVPGPLLPVIAIPTTSGTGSEVTPVAVLADDERELKVGISSPELIPQVAICDPELTLTCPAGLTAISGADALAHALEAFSAHRRTPEPDMALTRVFVGKNILSDQYALVAIRLIFIHLRRAVADGKDGEARSGLMLASTFAGLAFGTAGTSAAHAIQYPVGALTHTAHGLGIGTLLPYVMEHNASACAEDYAAIGRTIGVVEAGMDDTTAAQATIAAIKALFADIGIPRGLDALGVSADHIDWIADRSLRAARLVDNNPRPLTHEGVAAILRAALSPQSPHTAPNLETARD